MLPKQTRYDPDARPKRNDIEHPPNDHEVDMSLFKMRSSSIKHLMDNRDLVARAMAAPMLAKDHELALARRWRDHRDKTALDALTQSYLRLVMSMAARFRNYGLPVNDLVQEGIVGLMEAANRFDPDRDIRFSTYANWWIRSAMQDYILRNWSIVRTGTTAAHKSLFFNLRRLKARIFNTHDELLGHAARQSIATTLGVREVDVETMDARMSGGDRSLNLLVGEEGDVQLQDMIACDAPLQDEVLEDKQDSDMRHRLLREAMSALSEREQQIIRARQLAEDADQATLATIGRKLGISKERVRQIEAQAINKLRSALLARIKKPARAKLSASMA
jgi:RNA polymerase sigma-32 factor